MSFIKKLDSLEEKALIKVAIGLCQDKHFKETVLCLEKPTVGDFITTCYESDEERLEQWERSLEEQCKKLTAELLLAHTLKPAIESWINRMALEYLSYCRRQEALFGLSCNFMIDFIAIEDWSESGRLHEERLAERLVKDERLTVLQRYRIACVYCLNVDSRDCVIAALWKQFTPNEKALLQNDPNLLVSMWSHCMELGINFYYYGFYDDLLCYIIEVVVVYGNRVALMPCWRSLDKNLHQRMTTKMAFVVLNSWLTTHDRDIYSNHNKEWLINLVSFKSSFDDVLYLQRLNPPFYYSDLLCFFLSEMSEADQFSFFTIAFESKPTNYILECFLDWPHQDYFLPTLRKLWDILPQYSYGQCLLTLAGKYSGVYDLKIPRTVLFTKEDHYYDYQSLLYQLWEETPEDYKRYLFSDREPSGRTAWSKLSAGQELLPKLLQKYPCTEKVLELFQCFLRYATKEERKVIMLSKAGEDICSTLTQKEKWHFLDWLLKECLPENEITKFKINFIESTFGLELCSSKLQEQKETWLKNLINWCFVLNEERKEFKEDLMYSIARSPAGENLIYEDNFSEIERMMNFCLPSEQTKEEFKVYLAKYSSIHLIPNFEWEILDKILVWCFNSEEKRIVLKKDILAYVVEDDIEWCWLFPQLWENVKSFYEYFNLSDEEIKNLKMLFAKQNGGNIMKLMNGEENISPAYLSHLRCCLTDEQMILDFKKDIQSKLDQDKCANERLDNLIVELFSGLKNYV